MSTSFLILFTATATSGLYTLSLHDALPIPLASDRDPARNCPRDGAGHTASRIPMTRQSAAGRQDRRAPLPPTPARSEEHTSELQSLRHIVCRLEVDKNILD